MLVHLGQSTSLQVSLRGLLFSKSPLLAWALAHWEKMENCHPAADTLCATGRALSFFSTGRVDIADSWSNMTENAFTKLVHGGTVCQSSASGRTVKVGDSSYEVSLCDLQDLNMRFVYDAQASAMYYRQDTSTVTELIIVAIVSIFFVSSLSHNLITIYSSSATAPSPESKLQQSRIQAVVVLATLVYFIAYFLASAPGLLVLEADVTLAVHICVFIILEAMAQVWVAHVHETEKQKQEKKEQSADLRQTNFLHSIGRVITIPVHPESDGYVSILTASLLLLSCRVHFTFDTPYLQILVVVFGTRSIYKLFRVLHGQTIADCRALCLVEYLMQIIDMFIFSSLLSNGIAVSTHTELDALLATQTTCFFALCFGALLWLLRGLPRSNLEGSD